MKSTSKLIILVLTFLALAVSADAQSPREQLQQMVEQLQKTPTDNALREKAIALAAEIKPAPAVPEEARRAFIRGNTAFASAKDPAGFSRAIERFEEASALAPWWADPYFNLAKACEGAQDFDRALRALTYYRATATTEADKRQALDLTYALEEKRDLKKADATSASDAASREAQVTQARRFEGDWYRDISSRSLTHRQTLSIRRGTGDALLIDLTYQNPSNLADRGIVYTKEANVRDVQIVGSELRYKRDNGTLYPDHFLVTATYQMSATVTADGNTLMLVNTLLPFTASQAAYWAEWSKYVPDPRSVDIYKRQ